MFLLKHHIFGGQLPIHPLQNHPSQAQRLFDHPPQEDTEGVDLYKAAPHGQLPHGNPPNIIKYKYIYNYIYTNTYIYVDTCKYTHMCILIYIVWVRMTSLWHHWNDGECIGESPRNGSMITAVFSLGNYCNSAIIYIFNHIYLYIYTRINRTMKNVAVNHRIHLGIYTHAKNQQALWLGL